MNREEKGKISSAKGFANESRLLGALLARGYNASKVDLPHSTYDIVVELNKSNIIRLQVKTVSPSGSIPFTGGGRGGQDRIYVSDVKHFVHSTETADVLVGVDSITNNGESQIDFYFIPTILIENIGQKSIVKNKVKAGKNNWNLLKYCKEREQVLRLFGKIKKTYI